MITKFAHFFYINDIEQYQSKIEFSIFSRVFFARLWYEHNTYSNILSTLTVNCNEKNALKYRSEERFKEKVVTR